MLISTFQLHNVARNPVKELGLKPCCLAVLQANNLIPFEIPHLETLCQETANQEKPRLEATTMSTPCLETPKQPSPAPTPAVDLGDCLRAFKELSKEAASVNK